jgi:histidinol-phosphate aminotransferase
VNNKYWSDSIKELIPYTPGEQPKNRKFIKLNTNESPYSPSPKVLEAIRDSTNSDLRLYPNPSCEGIRKAVADYNDINENQVFAGNGSDEVLAFAFLAFFRNSKKILFPDITYSFYPVYTDIFKIDYSLVPLNEDFSIPVDKFLCENGGIIICNPNAPTGKLVPLFEIEKIIQYNTESVVIVDEAYIDFGGESAISYIEKYPNLLVIQTLSKSRQLAGLRIGFAMGQEDLILGLETVKNSMNSYTLDTLAQAACVAAMEDRSYFEITRQMVIATREYTAKKLIELGFKVVDSKANFLFASHPFYKAQNIFDFLREKGVLVRYFNKPRIDNYLRISIGTDEEMEFLLTTLEEYIRLG